MEYRAGRVPEPRGGALRAPALFGDDPRRGPGVLKLSMGMPDIEKDDLFYTCCAMGVARSRLGQAEEAAQSGSNGRARALFRKPLCLKRV